MPTLVTPDTPPRALDLSLFTLDTASAALLPASSGWIEVTGPDRVRWLNGMVTNSIQALQPGQGCYNFFLNAQGRIQADACAFAEPEALLLQTSPAQVPALLALLDRFIIMDDVELADLSDSLTGLGLAGTYSLEALRAAGLTFPDIPNLSDPDALSRNPALFAARQVALLKVHSPLVPRFEVWGPAAAIEALRDALTAAGIAPATPEAVEWLSLLEGTPRFGTDIRDRDLPQETATVDAPSGALHFSKGCYVGQEIVERIHSRGAVHRAFSGFLFAGPVPAPGTALEQNGKPVGEITRAASIPHPSGPIHLALGYIRRQALTVPAPLTYPGGSVRPVPLPHSAALSPEPPKPMA